MLKLSIFIIVKKVARRQVAALSSDAINGDTFRIQRSERSQAGRCTSSERRKADCIEPTYDRRLRYYNLSSVIDDMSDMTAFVSLCKH